MARGAGWQYDELHKISLRLIDERNRLVAVSGNAAAIEYADGVVRLEFREWRPNCDLVLEPGGRWLTPVPRPQPERRAPGCWLVGE